MSVHVLLVEDESDLRSLMTVHLKRERLEVTACKSGDEALKAFEKGQFSLAIIDWMLPGVSGIDLCKHFAGKVPVLMVTARSEPADIVLGLETGADDYITKPFELPVFLARVRALLRRSAAAAPDSDTDSYKIGDLTVNESKAEVTCDGKAIKLTASEFKLLVALAKNAGRVLSRERLMDIVQGAGITVTERVIDTHVYALRSKLGECSEVIETVRGIGYRIKAAE